MPQKFSLTGQDLLLPIIGAHIHGPSLFSPPENPPPWRGPPGTQEDMPT